MNDTTIPQKMLHKISHRGPNGEGIWQEETIALGHKRLSVIDLSEAGVQPIKSVDNRYVLSYNGELYNYQTLKKQLDYPFKTQTDTEVILAAYQKWGSKCLSYFNGMFAFAIWDRFKKELFIARDRMGIKPLYYFQSQEFFVFASEIRPLLATGLVKKAIDNNSLYDYLRFQTVHEPNTLVKDIYMLPSGTWMTISKSGITKKKYWSPISNPSIGHSNKNIEKQILTTLRKSVELRMMSDVPFGAFLSGGIDSSAIVSLMSEVATEKVNTFSVIFKEAVFSEAKYAQQIAQKYNTDHHEIELIATDFLNQIPEGLAAFDHPSGDGLNTYVVSKATKAAGITVALSGVGGDELFCGYPLFKRSSQLQQQFGWLRFFPQTIRNRVGQGLINCTSTIKFAKIGALLGAEKLDALSAYPYTRQVLLDSKIAALSGNQTLPTNSVQQIVQYWRTQDDYLKMPLLSQVSLLEIHTYMRNVLLRDTDQMSMANGLEVRVPFLDHKLVELILSISDKKKYPHSPKALLVRSLGKRLPTEIVNRPKMGFVLPFEKWMRNELKTFCEQQIISLASRPFFCEHHIYQLWATFLNGKSTLTSSRVWPLVVLEHWLQKNDLN